MIQMPLLGWLLASALQQAAPLAHALRTEPTTARYVTSDAMAMEHALAALAATAHTRDVDAFTIIGLAVKESHLIATSGPVGHWPVAPRTPPRRRNFICGVTQADFPTWAACVEARDPFVAYAAGAAQVQRWADACRRKYHAKNVVRCAYNGFAEGGRAAARGYGVKCRGVSLTCDRAAIVLVRAARLRAAVERAQKRARIGAAS